MFLFYIAMFCKSKFCDSTTTVFIVFFQDIMLQESTKWHIILMLKEKDVPCLK